MNFIEKWLQRKLLKRWFKVDHVSNNPRVYNYHYEEAKKRLGNTKRSYVSYSELEPIYREMGLVPTHFRLDYSWFMDEDGID